MSDALVYKIYSYNLIKVTNNLLSTDNIDITLSYMIIFFSFKINYSKKFIEGNILFIYAIRAEQKIDEIAFFLGL
jgi:hypothetical protein